MEILIHTFLNVLVIYLVIGLVFSIFFFFMGAARLDPLVKNSSWSVRLILLPGAIGLWIILLVKLFRK